MRSKVDQKGASALGDVIGGNKTEHHYHGPVTKLGIIEQLLAKLQAEVEGNEKVRHTVEALQYFQSRRSRDGVIGLEAKLEAGDRSDEYLDALAKKESSPSFWRNGPIMRRHRRYLRTSWRKQSMNTIIVYTPSSARPVESR